MRLTTIPLKRAAAVLATVCTLGTFCVAGSIAYAGNDTVVDGGSNNATMQGASLGSTFGPWGTVIGAGLGATSSYLSGRNKKKALKIQLLKL